ncbi:MAG: CRISPR-associated protein Cas4 [Micavibrio sp.]|nr:MAG: CRISPR-associated protein Cas4 [Micavibrio sp.]
MSSSSASAFSDPIFLSALEHYSYCPRQWALIHLEQQFADNVHTMRGHAAHKLVDDHGIKIEKGVRIERALPLYSKKLGLVGRADLVEFHPDGRIFPVEYKYGKKRAKLHDEIQLVAQAVCLEEMRGTEVTHGAIYHVSSHQRREVALDDKLRAKLLHMLEEMRQFDKTGTMPPPVNDSRCNNCSLIDICQPAAVTVCLYGQAAKTLFDIEEDE